VIATTALGVRHPLLSRRRFDTCIIDEASQLTQVRACVFCRALIAVVQPAIFGALLRARRFVLVGDHYQVGQRALTPH
jgi:DNA replication ATP-dependent helicase Dna2